MTLSVGTSAGGAYMIVGAINNGSPTFTDGTNAPFEASGNGFGDVVANPSITAKDALTVSTDLVADILSRASNSQTTLNTNAGNSVTNDPYMWGNGTLSSSNWTTKMAAAIAVNAGDTIVACVNYDPTNTIASAPTDSSGNVYTLATSGTATGLYKQAVYYAKNCAASAACVVTATYSSNIANDTSTIVAVPLHGVDTNAPLDVADTNTGTTGDPVSHTFTTNAKSPNEVILCFSGVSSNVTAAGSGYTLGVTGNDPFGDNFQYKIVSAQQSGVTAGMTQKTSGAWILSTVSFKMLVPIDPVGYGATA